MRPERVRGQPAGDQFEPAVAVLADGSYAITWTSAGENCGRQGVHVRRSDAAGVAIGSVTRANNVTANDQMMCGPSNLTI